MVDRGEGTSSRLRILNPVKNKGVRSPPVTCCGGDGTGTGGATGCPINLCDSHPGEGVCYEAKNSKGSKVTTALGGGLTCCGGPS